MFKNHLIAAAAVVAAASVTAVRAQESANGQSQSVSQTYDSATPFADGSGYGGTRAQSASGAMDKWRSSQAPACVGPASFCDIYKGGN
jgi:hypothetical protein